MNISIGVTLTAKSNHRDQASVLVQLGLLKAGDLPIAGKETALKVIDETSVTSNQLIKTWVRYDQ
jgi:hypothetical protein